MSDSTTSTRPVEFCVKDTLTTDEGRPLQETRYEYDEEGMLESQYTDTYYTMGNLDQPVLMRETKRDAYGIIVKETTYGEDGRPCQFPQKVLYEKGRDGLVQRVTVAEHGGGGTIFYIGYHGAFPHRRGLPQRTRFLAADGTLLKEYRYEYDEHGHEVGAWVHDGWDGEDVLEYRRKFEYDEHGRSIRLINYEDDQPADQYIFDRSYNQQGLCQDAVFFKDPDTVENTEALIAGNIHRYEYRNFL